MRRSDARRGTIAFAILVAGLAVALCAAIWIVDYIPTHDGPNHILHGYLDSHLHDPNKGYDQFLEPALALSNLGFHLPFAVLARLFPWKTALSLTLTMGALLWAAGFAAVAGALARERLALVPFGFATALSWSFYMGFFSFWMPLGLALLVIAYAIVMPAWHWRQRLILGAGTLIVAVGHPFVGELTGLVLVMLVWARPSGAGRLRDVLALAVVGAPTVLLAYWNARGASEAFAADYKVDPLAASWQGLFDTLLMPASCFAAGPVWRAALPPLAALAGVALLAKRRRQAQATELCIGATVVLLFVMSLALPFHVEVWKFLSPRFVPLWIALGIALLPFERVPAGRWRYAITAVLSLWAFAVIGWSAWHHRELARIEGDALAGASAPLARSGPRLPLRLRSQATAVLHAEPDLNMGHLYALEQGGMTPYLFATRGAIHPHVYKKPRPELFPRFPGRFYHVIFQNAGAAPEFPPRDVQLTWLALLGSQFEDVILGAAPEDIDTFVERGYAADFRRGDAAVMRYAGCGLDVFVAPSQRLEVAAFIEYGWAPVLETSEAIVGEPGLEVREEMPAASFARAPCGRVWVRVSWDVDRSGSPSAGDRHCAGADVQGRVFATSSAERHSLRCTAK
jgi:hypothetical protein